MITPISIVSVYIDGEKKAARRTAPGQPFLTDDGLHIHPDSPRLAGADYLASFLPTPLAERVGLADILWWDDDQGSWIAVRQGENNWHKLSVPSGPGQPAHRLGINPLNVTVMDYVENIKPPWG